MKPLWIIGAGGHAKVTIDAVRAGGDFEVVGCLDDNRARHGERVSDVPIVDAPTPASVARLGVRYAIVAIGANGARSRVAIALGPLLTWATIVHPNAWLAPGTQIGAGSLVCAGVVVQSSVCVGAHAILNTACSVDHDSTIGDFVHIAPGAHLAGAVRVGDGAFIGLGAGVIPTISIGDWATVGAGAMVIRDVDPAWTVVGVPARRCDRVATSPVWPSVDESPPLMKVEP